MTAPLHSDRVVAKALHASYEHDLDDAGRAVCDAVRNADDHLMVFTVPEWVGVLGTGAFGALVREAEARGCLSLVVQRRGDPFGWGDEVNRRMKASDKAHRDVRERRSRLDLGWHYFDLVVHDRRGRDAATGRHLPGRWYEVWLAETGPSWANGLGIAFGGTLEEVEAWTARKVAEDEADDDEIETAAVDASPETA